AEVLLVQVLLDEIEHRAIEGFAGGKSHVFQAFLQILGLDLLVAGDLEALDRRTLDDDDDEIGAVTTKLHVAKEVCGVESTYGLPHSLRRDAITDVHGQVVEYRALGDALQSFHANVAHGEGRVGEHLGERRCTLAEQWETEAPGQSHDQGALATSAGFHP